MTSSVTFCLTIKLNRNAVLHRCTVSNKFYSAEILPYSSFYSVIRVQNSEFRPFCSDVAVLKLDDGVRKAIAPTPLPQLQIPQSMG
ncbi:MAG: hypothetical protein RMX68_032460 [Aulosira sp. ZfuVER01]|nr:hypothetical protein [Aulosira sp. DedVER01a]MDZ8052892.1 hypothetical protein [Aulosira sp. ZfuCHP01]